MRQPERNLASASGEGRRRSCNSSLSMSPPLPGSISRQLHRKFRSDTDRVLHHAAGMDERIRRAALVTVRRAFLERFPPGLIAGRGCDGQRALRAPSRALLIPKEAH
jgi:hypothetical protein